MSIEPTPFVSMEVVGVRIEMPSNQPIVLLKEVGGDTFIPIWVGAAEATAIAFAQQGINPQRPLSHDLMQRCWQFKLLICAMVSSLPPCNYGPAKMPL
jgi:bifunctional DNase/RNase